MEGTSFPVRLSAFPVEVPLLPSVEYDFCGLHDFPARHGFTSSELRDLDDRPVEESASFVQSWLFFGLLADLTGTLVDRQSILHPRVHQHNADLRPLVYLATHDPEPGVLDLRIASALEDPDWWTLSQRISHIVQFGIDNVERIDRLNVAGKDPMPFVLVSIKILLSDLAAMRVERSGIHSEPWDGGLIERRLVPYPSGSSIVSSSAKALEGMMMAKGWCPSQVHRVLSSCDYSMAHYLSGIDRTTSEKTTHELCSSKHCQAYNSAQETYVTSHTIPGCQCSFIAAPTEQLDEIIRSGGVPLVSLHEASHGKLAIRVHTSKASSQYTAISHVWSGGLGNVQANSLPLCQLKYLNHCLSRLPKDGERGFNYRTNKFTQALSGEVWISSLGLDNLASSQNRKPRLFWMDTLCIPVDPKSSDLRMKAINKMDAVYAHAGEVLVLDSEVQNLVISDTHPCDLLARLAYSSWMGRIWTLQEGAIGRATYFQGADGALTLERSRVILGQRSPLSLLLRIFRGVRSFLRHKAVEFNYSETSKGRSMGHERLENVLLNVLLNSLHRGRDAENQTDTRGPVPEDVQLDSFVSVWNELIKRSTTKPEDIFAIFANLLDFNAGQIMKLPQDERMKAILWSSSTIPFSLLYSSGPRLKNGDSHRDRWVPTVPKGSRLTKSPSMRFTEDGLSFALTMTNAKTQPLAVIAEVDSLPPSCYLLDSERDKTYFVKAIRSANDTTDLVAHQGICIVMENFPGAEEGDVDQYAKTRNRGACLFITSRKSSSTLTPESRAHLFDTLAYNGVILGTMYDCPIRVWQVNNTEAIPESAISASENRDGLNGCPTIQCKSLKPGYELHLETGTYNMKISQESKTTII